MRVHHDLCSQMEPTTNPLAVSGPVLDRRGFVTTAAAATISALLASACGGGGGGDVSGPVIPGTPGSNPGAPSTNPAGVERVGSSLRIDLTQAVALGQPNGYLIISSLPAVIVLRLSDTEFRAFTAVCTHSGCIVSNFSANRINCACHGSQFDTRGQVVRGPASRQLVSYPVAYNAADQRLVVTV